MRILFGWIVLGLFFAAPLAQAGVLHRNVVAPKAVPARQNNTEDAQNRAIARQDYNFPASKYAALVMDAKTGEVLHARNADALRYPASLTKMMTLYLLFDALEKKKITLESRFSVSRRAAQQPQTNISLIPGEKIPVDTAIRALIIRSANDVAVVVAENLGNSVENFAQAMTQKARELGMRNTVFRNPNGLPDSNQHTTARDLAKLAIALRRDFPQYYSYFSVRQFSWKRVTYYTHNRVMLRYSGVDGLKTGYIFASGFNVATSLKRNGRTLIGVVMGGNNATARDDRMIALLEQTQQALAKRGNAVANMQPQNLPAPRITASATTDPSAPATAKIVAVNQTSSATGSTTITKTTTVESIASQPIHADDNANSQSQDEKKLVVSSNVITTRPDTTARAVAPVVTAHAITLTHSDTASKIPDTLTLSRPLSDVDINSWGIQVGAYEDRVQAEQALQKAISIASNTLQGSRVAVIGADTAYKTIHRARLENLTEDKARKACQTLISNQSPCFIYRVN